MNIAVGTTLSFVEIFSPRLPLNQTSDPSVVSNKEGINLNSYTINICSHSTVLSPCYHILQVFLHFNLLNLFNLINVAFIHLMLKQKNAEALYSKEGDHLQILFMIFIQDSSIGFWNQIYLTLLNKKMCKFNLHVHWYLHMRMKIKEMTGVLCFLTFCTSTVIV